MPDGDRIRERIESTNKTVMLIAAAGAGLAVLLLWLAARESVRWSFNDTWQAIVSNIGGLVLATALITVAWELAGKRSFADEVMAKANLSADVKRAGIAKVTDQYLDSVAWDELIDGSSKVDIVVAYASTWRNANRHRLLRVAARNGARIRIFLPDPDDAMTMSVLADRFSSTPLDLKAKVTEAIREFGELHTSGGADLEIYVRPGDAVFSCYRFDGRAVLTLYSHTRERRSSVPTFVVGSGDLWEFVYNEVQAIREQSRRVFPLEGK